MGTITCSWSVNYGYNSILAGLILMGTIESQPVLGGSCGLGYFQLGCLVEYGYNTLKSVTFLYLLSTLNVYFCIK